MHNINTNFDRIYGISKEFFEKETDIKKNYKFYPVQPKINDLEVISLVCFMEALGIDSDNLLLSLLIKHYASVFPNLIDRSRFNKRRKRFIPHIA